MKLNEIRDNDGARKGGVRVGRGIGPGLGKTAGRGQKGQTSRSGVSINGFEGGQMPLHMRIPKRGFNNIFAKDHAEVNLGQIQKLVDAGTLASDGTIDHAALKAAGVARGGKDGVRVLAKGALTSKLSFRVAGVSGAAKAAIEAAGGSVDVIEVVAAKDKHAAKHRVAQKERAADKDAKKAAAKA
ncbi:50S ribosomal protein L15 [Sphingomonas solaris]|uniref:Large ribosomal subunit protein uL15 n=1 Tax=Alterirhizorhabdus solaris TaxID=2529389 RepID=A0A558R069_9SPHN|nr:50S ribosomal protein L15 [Sphingomonas solaris]TVV72712.1 50S ribosomal protein L15 [Sphingomonas solaris]